MSNFEVRSSIVPLYIGFLLVVLENLAILGDQGLSDNNGVPDQIEMDNASEVESTSEPTNSSSAAAGGNSNQEYDEVKIENVTLHSSVESDSSVHVGHQKQPTQLSQLEALGSLVSGITLFAVIRIFVS